MPNGKSTSRTVLLLTLALLLTACAGQPTSSQLNWQQVKPAAIPALPEQAKQLPAPPECLPTCSDALTKERGAWRRLLIKPGPED